MRPLTTDFTEGGKRPYFLWDEDISVDELRERLRTAAPYERERLLGKMLREARDIDVWQEHGFAIEASLPAALEKDGGCTPATLAWLLSQLTIPDEARLPGDTSPADLRGYVQALVVRLRRLSAPG